MDLSCLGTAQEDEEGSLKSGSDGSSLGGGSFGGGAVEASTGTAMGGCWRWRKLPAGAGAVVGG